MSDQPPIDRFKPNMPEIPGLVEPGRKMRSRNVTPFLVIGALAVVIVVLFFVGRLIFRPKNSPAPVAQTAPQIEVPTPPPDPSASFPRVTATNPEVTSVANLSKPWSSQEFFFRNPVTGANVPSMVIRLPEGSPAEASGYWAFQLKTAYGDCQLEYITDIKKLKSDYDYRFAHHPMVGNPCTRTVFDPLRMTSLPGDVWVRGAMVQGSDLRPPLGVEIEVKDGRILALRME
jgi:hypothetical protein